MIPITASSHFAPNSRPAPHPGVLDIPAALLVSPYRQDRIMLELVFRQQAWQLFAVKTLGSARDFLAGQAVPLVICERDLPLANWKDLFLEIQSLPNFPLMVVISRMADEHLWSEVLNLGGHDVLAKPLRESEVLWVLRHAFSSKARGAVAAVSG